jgi:hypothetical protein
MLIFVSPFSGSSLFVGMEYGIMVSWIRKTEIHAAVQASELLIHSFPLVHSAVPYWLFVNDSITHFRDFTFLFA